MDQSMLDKTNAMVQGHVKIWDPLTQEVFIDKPNAIHYENMSEALATSIGNKGTNYISSMAFGNGATVVDTTGVITYLPPNTYGQSATLYNQTYSTLYGSMATLLFTFLWIYVSWIIFLYGVKLCHKLNIKELNKNS